MVNVSNGNTIDIVDAKSKIQSSTHKSSVAYSSSLHQGVEQHDNTIIDSTQHNDSNSTMQSRIGKSYALDNLIEILNQKINFISFGSTFNLHGDGSLYIAVTDLTDIHSGSRSSSISSDLISAYFGTGTIWKITFSAASPLDISGIANDSNNNYSYDSIAERASESVVPQIDRTGDPAVSAASNSGTKSYTPNESSFSLAAVNESGTTNAGNSHISSSSHVQSVNNDFGQSTTTGLETKQFRSYDNNNPEYLAYLAKFKYILYYGDFTDGITKAIIAVKPTFLVTNYYAMDRQTRQEFVDNHIPVIAYLPTHWTDRSLGNTLDEARNLLKDGADGIFVDESATMSNGWELWYYAQIYKAIKEFNKDAVVVINPGTASISEKSMLVADIICFEHEWRNIKNLNWASNYPGWRFMGISSNEFDNVMGYHVDANTALQDLVEARKMNIAYHYSTDHYLQLPSWLYIYGGPGYSLPLVSEYHDLNLPPASRPIQHYPIIETKTAKEGNKYNSTVVEIKPEKGQGPQQSIFDQINNQSQYVIQRDN